MRKRKGGNNMEEFRPKENRIRVRALGWLYLVIGIGLFGYIGVYLLMYKPSCQLALQWNDISVSVKQMMLFMGKFFLGIMAIVNGIVMILFGKALALED